MSLQYDELKQSYRSDGGKPICYANGAPTTIGCAEYPVSLIVVVTPPPERSNVKTSEFAFAATAGKPARLRF
jgi:hypothetical protein